MYKEVIQGGQNQDVLVNLLLTFQGVRIMLLNDMKAVSTLDSVLELFPPF